MRATIFGKARVFNRLMALTLFSLSASVFAQANAAPTVYGKTVGDWGHAWWTWVYSFPAEGNPLFVQGEMDCSAKQTGKVWFLAGNFGGVSDRTCTIPKGKALFIPVLNSFMWTPLDPSSPEDCGNTPGMSRTKKVNECRGVASNFVDAATKISCTLDDKPCQYSLQIVRDQSRAMPYMVNSGTIITEMFGLTPGLREISVSDGYWVMIDGLSPGKHKLQVAGRSGPPDASFELDVTYHLTVSASE